MCRVEKSGVLRRFAPQDDGVGGGSNVQGGKGWGGSNVQGENGWGPSSLRSSG